MGFEQNDYLGWYIPRIMGPESRPNDVNLHSSGVATVPPTEINPVIGDPFAISAGFEEALAKWLGHDKTEVVFTPGATGGTLLALLALSETGKHTIVESPIYEPMLRQAERMGPVLRLKRSPENNWKLPLDDAEEMLNDNTGVVMITEPHNPSGIFADRDEVITLADMAAKHGTYLLINEVYRGFGDTPSYHCLRKNIVVVSSLSKLIGAYWARLGWLSAERRLATRLRRAHWNMGMPTVPGAMYGLGFLDQADKRRQTAIEISREGIALVDAWVKKTPSISWHKPQSTGFGCIRLPDHIDDVEFAENLKGALVIPGSKFEAPGHFRISWLQSAGRLTEGLEILSNSLL